MQNKSLQPIDLSKILLPFENKWVALSEDQKQVLGSGETLKEAQKQIKKIKEKSLFLRVPPFNISFVPSSR